MTAPKKKIIRQYQLTQRYDLPDTLKVELTGDWQVLYVACQFSAPYLYVLEDVEGEKQEVDFVVVGTRQEVDASLVQGANSSLGSYCVPGNMLHVFGPQSSHILTRLNCS